MENNSIETKVDIIKNLEMRVAQLEGKIAGSWMSYTKDDYEKTVKDQIKTDLINFATKFLIAAIVFLGGAGYALLQSATIDTYRKENTKVISDLTQRYEENVKKDRARYEWKKHHDFANNYIHLAELYKNSEMDAAVRAKYMEKALSRASTYFKVALEHDPTQGTSYWEIGEINYSYTDEFGVSHLKNENVAYDNYMQAIRYYTDSESQMGWKADAQRMAATILIARANRETLPEKKKDFLKQAVVQLTAARDGYRTALALRNDIKNSDNFKKVEALLIKYQY